MENRKDRDLPSDRGWGERSDESSSELRSSVVFVAGGDSGAVVGVAANRTVLWSFINREREGKGSASSMDSWC